MSDPVGWSIANLKRLAGQEKALMPRNRERRLTEREQVRRFLARSELQRVETGEITPSEFHAYEQKMLKKYFNVEVK